MTTNNVIGRPVVGGDFFDREKEQKRIWRRLENDNVLLLAPRRVGKTSLLHRLRDTADQHEVDAVYVSVADRTREIDFIARLYEAIAKRDRGAKAVGAALRRFGRKASFKKLEVAKVFSVEFTNENEQRWQELGDALMGVLQETDRQWVIMVDELPLFVLELLAHGRPRARTFLQWFRSIRINQQASLSTRWILAGSIGLDTVASRERLGDTINDLAVEPLGAFSEHDADRFLETLADSHLLVLLRSRGNEDGEHHRFLLDALQNDGYLVLVDERYRFRSPLLRGYWRARVSP